MAREHVDGFFCSGELMLGSFTRFASHQDEQRLDEHEGKTFLVHRTAANGGQTLMVEAQFGQDAYVLSGSTMPSVDLMHAFGSDSAIVIRDPIGFATAVAQSIPGFVRGFDGPCSYQLRRIVENDLGWVEFGLSEETTDINAFDQETLGDALSKLTSDDVYFLKHFGYVSQAEWRFVWLVDHHAESSLIIRAQDAVQYCERWDSQGDVIAFGAGRA